MDELYWWTSNDRRKRDEARRASNEEEKTADIKKTHIALRTFAWRTTKGFTLVRGFIVNSQQKKTEERYKQFFQQKNVTNRKFSMSIYDLQMIDLWGKKCL